MTDAIIGTVLVIDDDPAVREALESLLRSVGFAAETYASLADFAARDGLPDGPSCLILDVRLPGRSGLEVQADLLRRQIGLPIIFITGHGDIPMSVRAMKAGAIEFLTKPFRDQDLLDALHQGLTLDARNRAEQSLRRELQSRYDLLSEREKDVMLPVVRGLLNRDIAALLGIAEVTVKVHRGQVMRKMAAQSVVDLARMGDRLGLLSQASPDIHRQSA